MEIALIILAVGVVVAALVLAFALRRPASGERSDPRLDSVLQAQGDIAGQFKQTVEAQRSCKERSPSASMR